MDQSQKELELFDLEDEFYAENAVPPDDIFAFSESRSCADLTRMLKGNQLDVKPDFQRELVWKEPAKARFLDSLLKNLPIPSMCIALDKSKTERDKPRIVIDGLQRISTIVEFLTAVEEGDENYKVAVLADIDPRISGKTAAELKEHGQDIIDQIQNVSIPVTVLRCDLSKPEHMEYVFNIFHRLNTGGTKLNSQEIRNCIFSGALNNVLFECSKKNHSELARLLKSSSKRFEYEELVLRFFAFQDSMQTYNGRLASFLNNYMKQNRHLDDKQLASKAELFNQSIQYIAQNLEAEQLSKVKLESLLYGVGKNLPYVQTLGKELFNAKFRALTSQKIFEDFNVRQDTMRGKKVKQRFEAAVEEFSTKRSE